MFKKSFMLLFILCSFVLYSKELSIYVNNSLGVAVQDAYVAIDDQIKKTDLNGYAQFNVEKNIVIISIEKAPYKSQQLTVNLLENSNINIVLKDSYDYYLNIYEDSNFSFGFDKDSLEIETVKDSIINIYKNGELIKSYDYFGKDLGVDLKKGDYTIVFYTIFTAPFVIENLKFDPKNGNFLNIKIPIKTFDVNGLISSNNELLGGAEIIFKDKEKKFSTYSKIDGTYNTKLPPGIYNLSINKLGYEKFKEVVEVSKNIEAKTHNLIEIPSLIKGRILDSKGNFISNESILIKNNGNDILVKTDDKGYYEVSVYTGLAFVKVDISGFFPTGRVERIDSLSTKEVNDIILKERVSSISGTVTDGILPLNGINVKLYDSKEKYFGMKKTDSKGYFYFEEVRSGIEYLLVVDDSNYGYFKSNSFINEDNANKNFTFILNNNNLNFILELKNDLKSFDYSTISVYINNIKFQPDKNGIINETIQSLKEIENLTVEIPKLGMKNIYKISELGSEPHLITIKF